MRRASNPRTTFSQYFEIVPARSESLKDHVYEIRHRVYCEDLAYEPVRSDRRERDEHDEHSLHLLIRSVQTGEFIGCTRVIRPSVQAPDAPLPFERICAQALDRSIVDPARLPRHAIAEVSRLAVVASFRRRKGEDREPLPLTDDGFGTIDRPRFPYIPIGLYLASVELARLNGIDHLFVLTDERLARHFGRLGVQMQTIGRPVEHRGLRIPSMMDTRAILDTLRPILRPVYRAIVSDIRRDL